jgi:hypothetical protein
MAVSVTILEQESVIVNMDFNIMNVNFIWRLASSGGAGPWA